MKSVIGLLIATSLSFNAHAFHVDMKPGLWEHKFKMDPRDQSATQKAQAEQMAGAMEEMKKQMANLPPDQRKMMEDMMAQQGIKVSDKGVEMPSQGVQITKDGTTVKACLTQEDIDRGELPKGDDNCEEQITQTAPNTLKVVYICGGENPSRGEGTIVFQNNKSYTGDVAYTTTIEGKQETFRALQTGKWLSTNCGDIKPQSLKNK
ncbi:MAG: DUF3617 domain-containing protein [Gammaproteobacteria bacterium]|nr:MAG: DUF3617 domain-containing protein [Gammaproteobacteria bacterium]